MEGSGVNAIRRSRHWQVTTHRVFRHFVFEGKHALAINSEDVEKQIFVTNLAIATGRKIFVLG